MRKQSNLPVGLYDRVLTSDLKRELADLVERRLSADTSQLDPNESHVFLASAIGDVLERVLKSMPWESRLGHQLALCNDLLDVMARSSSKFRLGVDDHLLEERLLAVFECPDELAGQKRPPAPGIPLVESSLLVNAPKDYQIGSEIRAEVESADGIDLLCSFVKWSGYVRLREALRRHCEKGRPLRVLTTTYMGATEARALDELHELGANVRVSYDSRRTRLHAKAWYFHRRTGFDTAFIGSSNLSAAALSDGLEWNVRVSASQLPRVAAKFRATFDNYWSDGEFEPYDPACDAERLRKGLRVAGTSDFVPFSLFDLRPYPFQEEILEQLWTERRVRDQWKNLVVAATGTGKTIMAAFDYSRARKELGSNLSLLFVAHRKEILKQSLATFRHVLRQPDFGELFVDGQRPYAGTHVFASVQSLAHVDLSSVSKHRYDMIIVDEVHHASAPTYQRLLDHFEPGILLGLTATPERTDGSSIKAWFNDRFAAELRLWDAIDRGLLSPFQYFVLNDEVDLSRVKWARGRYSPSELDNLYTGNDARVRLILGAVKDYVVDVGNMKALGFCVGVEHARFMAHRFNEAGIPAASLTGETDRETREARREELRSGRIKVLFTVDLFNEGVDIPEVDTVLFLRPTESAMLFLQQLGRGLRLVEGKECLTALDFVGQMNRRFRFDLRLRALTGATKNQLPQQLEQGFPYLPSGCSIQLDRVAQQTVLENLKQAVSNRRSELIRELQSFGAEVTLGQFLEGADLELEDIYRQNRTWTELRHLAGFKAPVPRDEEAEPLRALKRVLHWDDTHLLDVAAGLARGQLSGPGFQGTSGPRRLAMVVTSLYGRDAFARAAEVARRCHEHNVVRFELNELVPLLVDRIRHRTPTGSGQALKLKGIPLRIHCTYSRDEIMASHGVTKSGQLHLPREGVYFDKEHRHNLLFVTLEKTEKHYSPTTMYEDYALSTTRFHWQSQSTTSPTSKKGERHIHHKAKDITPLLFVRERKKDDRGVAMPYLFAGPLEYESHDGSRPMSIVWKLKYPLPMDTYRTARVIGG